MPKNRQSVNELCISCSKHRAHNHGQSDCYKQVPSPSSLQSDVISTALRHQTLIYRLIPRCNVWLLSLVDTLQAKNKQKSRTKTNRRTDREQYTRSNAANARPLTLVKPAETLVRDWLNTNERREMMTSTITLPSTIYRRNIKLTGTLRHVLRVLLSTTRFRKLVY